MPFLNIFTTVSRAQIPEKFGPKLIQLLSTTLRNKTPDRIAVHVVSDQQIWIGQDDESVDLNKPIALVYLRSIGSMDIGDNRKTAKDVTDFIHENLGIEKSRIRMVFQNQSTDMTAANGKLACD